MKSIYKKIGILFFTYCCISNIAFSQVNYNDGPIRLRVWVHKVWSNANCGEIGDQEYIIRDIRARTSNVAGGFITSPSGLNTSFSGSENRYYTMGQLQSANVPGGVPLEANGYKLLDVNYSGTQVPTQFDVYIGSAFESDCTGDALSCGQGSLMSYEGCCCLFGVCALGDDYLYTGSGWTTVNFRPGPEGQINYTQPVVYRQSDEHSYSVVYAYQWDWTGNVKNLCSSPNYKDGPITLTTELIGVFSDADWDGGTCGISIGGDEDLRIKVLAKDNLTGSFGNFPTGLGSAIKISQNIPKWNNLVSTVFTRTYTIADINMQTVDLAWDLWEEDSYDYGSVFGFGLNCGTDDNYEGTDYAFPFLCINGDDAHIVSRVGAPGSTVNIGYSLNWRNSPANTFNTVDVPVRIGSSTFQNWFLRFRYRWTISPPTVSINTTDLSGCLPTPIVYSAANVTTTNATYFQWQVADITSSGSGVCPSGANWTNVSGAVCPNISFPLIAGTKVYRLVVYNRNGSGSSSSSGPKYDSAISNCLRVTYFPYAPPIISSACGKTVPSGSAITFSVPTPPAANAIASGATYSWSISPTSNVSPTTGTGTTFSPTFLAAAAGTTYTVTLTVIDACAATNATSTCTFLVSTPSCDQIYVAPAANGGNDGNPGTASQPYLTIANAIANISGSRNHVHIMGGVTYNNEPQWLIPADAIIDGGWEIVSLANDDWRKNSSLTTTVNLNPSLENNGTVGFYRGVVSSGNGWLIQDLTINVKNGVYQPSASTQFNSRGCTIYGVYANSTSGWEIKRTTINTGIGTNGANGTTPAGTGGAGGGGTSAGDGGNGSLQSCYGGGMTNGAGGGGGATNNGSAGSGGGGGNWNTGGDCNILGCDANGAIGGAGGAAPNYGQTNGPTIGLPNFTAGVRPATPNVASLFYVPAGQATTGGSGGGGGRGGGGGGGDVGTCCLACPFSNCGGTRPNGGAGGVGGDGGIGGSGGYGGGGSFGTYFVNGSSGSITNSIVNLSAGGTGGNGANGQGGSFGSSGAIGTASGGCDGDGRGGTGGRGGDGAPGGRGQDGANGLAQAIVSIASTITQTNSTPNGPNAVADFLKARYYKGCTNSFIEIQKAAGSSPSPGFDLAAMLASPINDESPNTSSFQYTTSGSLTTYVQFNSQGWKQEKLSLQNGWSTFIRITETRSLPTIDASPKRICSGQTTTFSIFSNNPNQDYSNTAADYEWRYRIYKDGNVRRTPVPSWTIGTGAGPNTITPTNATTDTITYLISGRVRDKCCGWSIWVYDTVVVFPSITPATAWTSVPANGSNICIKGAPATLSVNIPTGYSGGVSGSAYLIYRYSTDGGVTWTAWSTTRPTAITKVIGSTIVESAYVSPTSPPGCDTAYTILDINWTISDSVQATAGVVSVAACGNPNSAAIISAAAPAIGSGQWTQISGASSSVPATPTSTLTLDINGVPFNTTNNVYRWTVTNGACSDFTEVTINTPNIVANAITLQSDACYTCTINNGVTYSYYDFSGKIVATIEDYATPVTALDVTEVCTHIHPYVQQTWTVAYPIDSQPYLQRYWTIRPANNTNSRVTLYFTAAEYNALQLKAAGGAYAFGSTNDLRVSKFPGGGGAAFTPPHVPGGEMLAPSIVNWSGNGTDYQASFDCNSFSTFYIHPVRFPYEVLPVELISFTGSNIGDKNRLEWITASEINSNRFVVEKSIDGVNWFYLGEKPAAGNSSQRLTYELFDNFPVVGSNYYRLKSIDNDETFSYSKIINIILGSVNTNTGIIGVYPNPTSSEIKVLITSAINQNASVKIYDVLGKVVKMSNISLIEGVNNAIINLNSLANATYVIVMTDEKGNRYNYKIIKQ